MGYVETEVEWWAKLKLRQNDGLLNTEAEW